MLDAAIGREINARYTRTTLVGASRRWDVIYPASMRGRSHLAQFVETLHVAMCGKTFENATVVVRLDSDSPLEEQATQALTATPEVLHCGTCFGKLREAAAVATAQPVPIAAVSASPTYLIRRHMSSMNIHVMRVAPGTASRRTFCGSLIDSFAAAAVPKEPLTASELAAWLGEDHNEVLLCRRCLPAVRGAAALAKS